jgi:N-sulfoglucosamine sulfohydrolase
MNNIIKSLGFVALLLPVFAQADTKRPNILWVIAEDMSPNMGAYGYTNQVSTPNVDALAAQGVRYDNAFTTAPICSTSRSGIMTGMYGTSIDVQNHRSHKSDGYHLPDGVKVITDWLRPAGYYTANIVNLMGDSTEKFVKGTGKTDWNFTYDGKPFDTSNWSDLKNHQPFYAQINFAESHRMLSKWSEAKNHIDTPADPAKVTFPVYYPDHPVVREDWANYLNSIMAMDKKLGMVMQKLEEDGLADNTIVIFFSDHGQAHVRGKQWVYDSGLRIPLIVRIPPAYAPSNFKANTVNNNIVSAIDINATTLQFAGVKLPEKMQGQVFIGKNVKTREYAFSARDRADEAVDRIRSVRDSRFRYIRNYMPEKPFMQRNRYKEYEYPAYNLIKSLHASGGLDLVQAYLMNPTKPEEELYEIAKDPDEIHNLALEPAYAKDMARFRKALAKWEVESDDKGRTLESEEIVKFWENEMIEYFEKGNKKNK